jgi:hypothetical protein
MAANDSLTEALGRGQVHLVFRPRNGSNLRSIPYEEVYRESSVQRETPAERVQRIAMGDDSSPQERT